MEKSVLSTKTLNQAQQQLIFNSGIGLVHYDALKIEIQTIPIKQNDDENYIITSKNAIESLPPLAGNQPVVFCVGSVTAALLRERGISPIVTAANGVELARIIVDQYSDLHFKYLCGDHRREELPKIFADHQIIVKEEIVYKSTPVFKSFDRIFAAVLFYSPRGVHAFAKANKHQPQQAICIGETTATTAREIYSNVIVAKKQTVENVLVTAINVLRDDKK